MEHTIFEVVDSHERQEVADAVPAADIQKTLSAILLSAPFRSSKQSQLLLQYIVNQTLIGHVEMLKERIIGANLFNRRPDYDTNSDPIVRARAAEVRKRLALYYQSAHEEAILISVPSGSFKALFEWTNRNSIEKPPLPHPGPEFSHRPVEIETPPIPHEAARQELPPFSSRIRRSGWWIAIAASVVLLAGATGYYLASSEERAFNQFWSPILDNPHTTLIYVGGNAVYQLSSAYVDAYYRQHPRSQAEEMGFESYIPLPPGTKIDAQDLYPAKDTFVTIGDVAAITKIESLLVRRNRQFDIRYGGDVTYGDLRQSPTILVGAHNNSWTLAMTENLRYVFNGRDAIVDRSNPQKRWSSNAAFTEDYAIVSRVLNSKTGTTMITLAGVGFAGTQAAAEFVTNSQSISALVKSLPTGWEKKNLQIVLHTTVTNRLPGAPDVVATYCW
jgi:hypothetical protein